MLAPAFFALAVSSLAVAQRTSVSADCSRTYDVVEGDYCDAISAAHNVSTYQLAVLNTDKINEACTNLEIGDKLCLGKTSQDCATTYDVKEGDYCDLIAGNFNINSTLLMTNNPQIDDLCYNLYVGEVLCVDTKENVTPAPAGFVLPGSTLDGDDDDESSTDETDTGDDAGSSGSSSSTDAATSTTASTSSTSSTSSAAATTSAASSSDDTVAASTGDDEDDDDLPDCED